MIYTDVKSKPKESVLKSQIGRSNSSGSSIYSFETESSMKLVHYRIRLKLKTACLLMRQAVYFYVFSSIL
jgi:hypothetical protein